MSDYRIVTRHDGASWIYKDNKEYCGPFATRGAAMEAAVRLQEGEFAFPNPMKAG
jgi:hypothetical protein